MIRLILHYFIKTIACFLFTLSTFTIFSLIFLENDIVILLYDIRVGILLGFLWFLSIVLMVLSNILKPKR